MDLLSKFSWQGKNIFLQTLSICNYIFNRYHSGNFYIVFGSGRSGTTLLVENLAQSMQATMIDEPLKNSSSHIINKIGFTGWGQYIPEHEESWIEANVFFHRLLTARFLNPNILKSNKKNPYCIITKFWLIKFIRANFLMPWLIRNFSLPKPLYIIRNPYAVVSSQLRHEGWGKGRNLLLDKEVIIPKFKYYDSFYEKYQERFSKVKWLDELLTLRWCLENEYVINHKKHNVFWNTISYEDLILNANERLKSLLNVWSFKNNNNGVKHLKASYSASDDLQDDPISQLSKWQKNLSSDQKDRIEKVLSESSIGHFWQKDSIFPVKPITSIKS